MKEVQNIVAEFEKIDFTSRKAAMATVVQVHGSSYRSPGARMLITDDGRWVGSISGGCLEGDALRKARQVMMSDIPMTVTYDTREESNQNLGIGLGCNGVIDVFIEPLHPSSKEGGIINLFHLMTTSSKTYALATIIRSDRSAGQKLLIDQDGNEISSPENPTFARQIKADALKTFDKRKSEVKRYALDSEEIDVFLELVQPPISLIIFGGGFDARPVSQLAKMLGWNVVVTDECVAHIAPVFFPTADKLSLCNRSFVDRDFNITELTACVLMSHNYEYDRDVLRKLLPTQTPYIGILGPRKRFTKMQEEFQREGTLLTPGDLARIHSPIGLDIGAETPDEIAISIISEIQGKFANRSGGFLKYRQGPIHERKGSSGEISKQFFILPDNNTKASNE